MTTFDWRTGLSDDEVAAVEVYVALSDAEMRGSDQAWWLGVDRVVEHYRDAMAERAANGEPLQVWSEWQADMADARC